MATLQVAGDDPPTNVRIENSNFFFSFGIVRQFLVTWETILGILKFSFVIFNDSQGGVEELSLKPRHNLKDFNVFIFLPDFR